MVQGKSGEMDGQGLSAFCPSIFYYTLKVRLKWYNGKNNLRYNETKRINERENIVMNGGTLKGVAFWENG